MTAAPRPAAGFTLIEAIVAMVITGILAGIVAVFIAKPVEGYVDAVRRAELTDAADVALRRLTRDLRLAVPNTLRLKNAANAVVNSCASGTECYVEFIMTKAGGRYRESGDGSTGGTAFNWTDSTGCGSVPANCRFDVLGPMPANPAIADGDYIVIYNLGAGYEPANAYLRDSAQCDATPASPGCNIAKVAAGGVSGNTITLDANPFAFQAPPLPSPGARFQVVDKDDKVIRYGCVNGTLTRYKGCGFTTTTSGCTGSLLAGSSTVEPKATCVIEYQANATGRNGLLSLRLKLADTPSGESAELFQQIHVDNSP